MEEILVTEAASFRVAVFRLARRIRAEKSRDDLTDLQFVVLGWLYKEPTTLSKLAEYERVSLPTINRAVNELVKLSYLLRNQDPEDRRKNILSITAAGRKIVDRTIEKRNIWITEQLDQLSKEEQQVVSHAVEIFQRMAAN